MNILNDLKVEDIRIIGQSAEREVIFCYHTKRRRILCFDQHAADERIRYEQLLDNSLPPVDLDSIKSRACHGAIRFGDPLTLDQCHELIEKLLNCKIPFKCAHSRCGVSVLESLDELLFLNKIKNNDSRSTV